MFKTIRDRRDYHNKRRQQFMDWIREYKKDKVCFNCGWNIHPEILQFHHRNKSSKEFKITKSNSGNLSKEKILKEIKKCDLLCPNCHFWLHFKETAKISPSGETVISSSS